MSKLFIREAREEDVQLILDFIKELAVYEKMEADVIATPASILQHVCIEKNAHCLLAFEEEMPIGFALYFYNFSTFLGKKGLYLEDLFVRPEHRAKGYGKALLMQLVQIATQENCGRMEWSVLNWNTPAIDFYQSLGAIPMDEWKVYRLTESAMGKLVGKIS